MPEAYLSTIVTRLGIDRLRSAQVKRETYVGEWLPEPVVTEGMDDPIAHAEMSDSLSLAFIVVLERLTPEQRAVSSIRRPTAGSGIRSGIRNAGSRRTLEITTGGAVAPDRRYEEPPGPRLTDT